MFDANNTGKKVTGIPPIPKPITISDPPPPAAGGFNPANFSKGLNATQQKDFASLQKNTGGNLISWSKNAGASGIEAALRARYGLGAGKPPVTPPVTPRPIPRPISPPGMPPPPGFDVSIIPPVPVPVGGGAVSHGPGSGAPPNIPPRPRVTPPAVSRQPGGNPLFDALVQRRLSTQFDPFAPDPRSGRFY